MSIKITNLVDNKIDMPTIPFFTLDRDNTLRLYYEESYKIQYIIFPEGDSHGSYRSLEDVVEDFEDGERVVEAEITIKR